MTYENMGRSGLEYLPCSYGDARLRFRGPRKRLEHGYVACLGGTETYGRFLQTPFPVLIEERTGVETLNLGVANGGPEAYLNDPPILDLANQAQAIVLQITDAQNCSNRFYNVHPRRNDRFLQATAHLRTLFPEADFTEFHFTGHLLAELERQSRGRFEAVVTELKSAWLDRMQTLLGELKAPVVLLWMGERGPRSEGSKRGRPNYIDADMIKTLRPQIADYVEVIHDPGALRTEGMIFNPLEALAARELLGIDAHHHAARALIPPLNRYTVTS